jgi:ABC-type sugar transport system permease subunit
MALILVFIYGYSLIKVFDFSMRRVRGITGVFIGLTNYKFLFKDPIFRQAIVNNFKLFIIIPVLIFLALIFAVLLFERMKGRKFYRVALFLPYILAIPVVGIIFGYMFTLNGVVNEILKKLQLNFLAIDWLGDPKFALWTLMIIITWKELGFGIALFLARLMSVDQSLYDSAEIDGANWWQKLFSITVPQLKTIIEFFMIITIINMLSWVFAYCYTITMGGPGWSTIVMELYIYNKLARSQIPNPGTASSASVVLFLITIVLIVVSFRLRKRIEEE